MHTFATVERHSLDNGDRGQIYCEYIYAEKDDEFRSKNDRDDDGTNIVFLVDGVCNDGFQFEKFIERCCSHNCYAIRYDYRGHGRSSNCSNEKPLTVETCVSDMKKVLEHFYRTHPNLLLKEGALEEERGPRRKKRPWSRRRRVTLISYSLGAQVALKFAIEEIGSVNGVGIVNGTLEPAFYGLFRSEFVSDCVVGALRRSASFQLFVAFWIRICMVLLSLNGFVSSLLASYFVKASAKNFKPFWTHARRVQARSYLSFLVDAHSREGMDILECLGSSSSQVGGVKKSALPLLCIVGMKDTLVRTHKTVETVRRLAPECDVVAVKDGCHALLVHDAHAEKTADVLLDFVNRCSVINKSAKTMTTSNVEWNDPYDDDEEAYDRKTMNALLA